METTRSLPEVLSAAAGRHPGRVALTGSGLTMTYRDLDVGVRGLAADLRAGGLRPGDLVGIGVEHGALPLVLSAAVMRAGCAYVPLDIRQPLTRLRHIAGSAGLEVVLCDAAGETALRDVPVTTMLVDLDDIRSAAGRTVVPPAPVEVHLDAVAYVMFTSGSSGVPKGVPITHASLLTLLGDALGLFSYGDDEVWPLIHGYGFDVSVWEMWAAIATGATLIVLDGPTVASPARLAETLARYRPTRLHMVPSVFGHLADAIRAQGIGLRPRSVIFCGEPINHRAIQTWNAAVPGPPPAWINVYGITETTVYNTFHALTADDLRDAAAATPIGRPYRSSSVLVLGDDLRPVAPGETGELVIGGPQLSPGYLGNAALTAERFLDLDAGPGRWYRTGDLGFRTPAGVLHYLGRADDQVKVRGHRIELGEIDSALRQIPWVRDGAAALTRSPRGEPMIAVYVVPTGDSRAEEPVLGRLRSALARLVPDYMLPGRATVLDRLPQNANGKTDRRALAEPAPAAMAGMGER
ncbi:amino acid adenylation domain-containing protein [Actinoplanes sp. NPDC049265]|uniref:amino acid adenylation domain-containing protein n=1 Tax=Actinoplanes sp. NPDC049265 TaxID=3363902 RepID=UPI0037105E70